MQMRRAREMIVNLIDDPEHYFAHFAMSVNVFFNVERFSSYLQIFVLRYDVSSI